MDINAMSALTAYSYQNTLAQTGSAGQALTRALAIGQAQVGQMASLFSGGSPSDPLASLAGASAQQALAAYAYDSAASSGNGASAAPSLLATMNSGSSSLWATTNSMPLSTALLAPSTTAALARYAYDQSQNQTESAAQAAASGQQSLIASGWNLLA